MNELDLFAAAIAITDLGARESLLDRECAGRPDVRQRIDQLIDAHFRSHPLLDQPVPEQTGAYVPNEQPDAVIAGRYKLLEQIGEGGMGTVWVAEQTQPVRRKVALKLIKAGMDSKSVIARFEAERQALAVMDHPNVAKVLDGGLTEAGRPFFVMEYVKGVPITDYCDATRLSVPERLQLFAQVCHAVQHAHQKGIIHRDLKPSNILVAPYDDKPVPKIIDFGLAKAMHQSLTEQTLHTAHDSVLGTPLYMSPEQAQLNNLDVDTRSDIYSLGVLLYELLTGTTPLEKKRFKEAAWDEIKRIIREEEPPRPSARLSSTDTLPSLAASRQTEPVKLTKLMRGELDWIVMKSLEKDRTRRYETANGFAADVLRYLSGEAVQAHPPSAAYRLRKFVRRYKGQVIAASLVFAALVAGVIGTSIGLIQANQAAENERLAKIDALEKQTQAETAEQRERERAVGEQKERARAEKAYARTADVLDTMVSEVTGDSLATQKTITAEQKKFLAEVLTYYKEFAGQNADDTKSRARTARAALRVSGIEFRLGRKEEAAKAIVQARESFLPLAAESPAEYRRELALCHSNLGVILMDQGRPVEAEKQHRKSLALRETLAAESPGVPECRQLLADSYGNIGHILAGLGMQPEGALEMRKSLDLREKLVAEFPAAHVYRHELAIDHSNLGVLLMEMGRKTEAKEQFAKGLALREKLAAEFPDKPENRLELAKIHINLGIVQTKMRNASEAEENYQKALTIQSKLVAEYPAVPVYRQVLARGNVNMATLLTALGRRQAAEKQYRNGLAVMEKLVADFPAEPVYRKELGQFRTGLGGLLKALGKQQEAEQEFRKGLANLEKLATDFPAEPSYRHEVAVSSTHLGFHLHRLGKLAEAEEHYRKALAIQEKLAAEFPNNLENRVGLGGSYCNIANTTRDRGTPSESVQWFDKAIAMLTSVHERDSQFANVQEYLVISHVNRAIAHKRLQQLAESIRDWSKAVEFSPPIQKPTFRASRAMTRLLAGQVAEAVAEVAEVMKLNWDAERVYDFACAYAIASGKIADKKDEYAKQAMELLQRAVKAGYNNAAHMKSDTDLDAIRGREDFKKLLADLETK